MPLSFSGLIAVAKTPYEQLQQDPRHRNHPSNYKYTRRRAGKWQARYFRRNMQTMFYEHVNLGLFDSEEEAFWAVSDFVRNQRRPPGMLPKFIRQTAEGFIGVVRQRQGSRVARPKLNLLATRPFVLRTKACETATDADREIRRLIKQRFGKQGLERFYPFG